MKADIEAPTIGWKTLNDIFEHYLAQTPDENGIPAVGIVRKSEANERVRKHFETIGQSPSHLFADMDQENAQADRMRAIVTHIMIKEAAAGVWFALGRRNAESEHELIDAGRWNFALLNIAEGAIGRDNWSFKDLYCMFAEDAAQIPVIYDALLKATSRKDDGPTVGKDGGREEASPFKTGLVGRPSGREPLLAEMLRRKAEGLLKPTLAEETECLAEWFNKKYHGIKQVTPKAVANSLRHEYWRARGKPEKANRPKLSVG